MIDKQNIRQAVWNAMDRANELLLEENALPCEDETLLLGNGAQLDSMGFVNFMIALEEELAEKAGLILNVSEELNSRYGAAPTRMTAAELVEFLTTLANRSNRTDQVDTSAR